MIIDTPSGLLEVELAPHIEVHRFSVTLNMQLNSSNYLDKKQKLVIQR